MESNPVNVSPAAATHSSHSNSPLVDLTELQTNASLATDHLLSIKRLTDLRRQGVIWELRLLLQQNEAEGAALIEKAKATHRQGVLNIKVSCTKAVLEAKSNYRAAMQEAKMVRSSQLQELEVAYGKALSKATAERSSQSAAVCGGTCQDHVGTGRASY